MEILKKIFLVVFLMTVVLFVGVSLYIQRNGKVLVEQRLSAALQKEVHVGKAQLLFPLGLRFDNVEIKDALTAKILRIHLGLPLFFGGQFNIAKVKLTEPVFFITFSNEKKVIWGKINEANASQTAEVLTLEPSSAPEILSPTKIKSSKGISINYLEVKEGKVEFLDQAHNNLVEVGKINLKAMDFALPSRNMKTKFDLTALMISDNAPFAGQKMEARGMVNFVARNMDATVKVVDPGGNAGFSAHLKSLNNEMTVKGKINVRRFIAGIKTKDSKESSLEGFLADALESSGVDIGVDFTCQTKMDNFNCDKLGMSGNVVQSEQKTDTVPVAATPTAPR